MKVLVTGGTGFIGTRLISALLGRGCSVRLFTRKAELSVFFKSENIEIVSVDLLSSEVAFGDLLSDCSVIFNCAGELRDESRMRLLHVDSTMRLVNAAKEFANKNSKSIHWVQLSSVGAYGPPLGRANLIRVVTEETTLSPVGTYEITKTEADKLLAAAEDAFFTYSILRPSNVYGAEMPNNSLRQWASLIKKNLFFFVGKPGAISTYIHVDDVVSALLLCGFDQRARGEIFNLSNDCTQEQLVSAMAKALNVSTPWLRLPEWIVRLISRPFFRVKSFPITTSRIDALVARTQYPAVKLKQILGYEPAHKVTDTVAEVLRGVEEK